MLITITNSHTSSSLVHIRINDHAIADCVWSTNTDQAGGWTDLNKTSALDRAETDEECNAVCLAEAPVCGIDVQGPSIAR